jgi:hypothetical protein
MRKRPSYWPSDRSLFREKARRRRISVWIVFVLSIVAAMLLATLWRQPVP